MLRTSRATFQEFEVVIKLSCSRIRDLVPMNVVSEPLRGFSGKKIYGTLIQIFVELRHALVSAERLSPRAVNHMLAERTKQMTTDTSKVSEIVYKFAEEAHVDVDLQSYLLAEYILVVRQVLCLPSLFISSQEQKYLFNPSVLDKYLDELRQFLFALTEDLDEIESNLEMTCITPQELPFLQGAREVLGQSTRVLENRLESGIVKLEATRTQIKNLILKTHFSNVPFLFFDVLKAQGHVGDVIDGPGDGSRDIETKGGDGTKYFTQVKCVRNPPIGQEQIRQFAQTCRTYGCKRGYYVTTFRFSRNANSGLWPQIDPSNSQTLEGEETRGLEKIADIELVDLEKLTDLVLRYGVGVTAAGYINQDYWATMRLPGGRRRETAS